MGHRSRRIHNRIKDVVVGIARGMSYLHSKGIVLCDLTPRNVGCSKYEYHGCPKETVKLFAFGMHRAVQDARKESQSNMAPEVIDERSEHTEKSDTYSFGLVLCEIFTLRRPDHDI